MWVLLSLVGFLGFIVAIGALLWSFIKKNKNLRKKSLIGGLLAMIMFFIGVMISPSDESESSVETAKTEQTSKKQSKKNQLLLPLKRKTLRLLLVVRKKLAHLQKRLLARLAQKQVQVQKLMTTPQIQHSPLN